MAKGRVLLRIYKVITWVALPFIYLFLLKRKYAGKEDSNRFNERLGHPMLPRPEGNLVWVHAASVGEALSVLPLIKRLCEEQPDQHILMTTGTVSSARMIESKLPKQAFHQFLPIDVYPCVRRFLNHWQPNLVLWLESEFWPNMLSELQQCCPVVLLNARISDRSYHYWMRFHAVSRLLLQFFSLCLAQSERDAKRLQNMGAIHVKYIGNIKFDSPSLPSDSKKMGELVSMLGDRPVWLAASTHHDEESMVADTHAALKQEIPNLLTIIAPRHPKRSTEISQMVRQKELKLACRSAKENIGAETDIYLADTLGELGMFYRLVSVVFIGGSLVPHGGQNPLEPARLDCAVLFGPHMENFAEIVREILHEEAAIEVQNGAMLTKWVESLLQDHDRQEELAEAIAKIVDEKSGVLDRLFADIGPFLPDSDKKEEPA